MSAHALLTELNTLLQEQVEHIATGDTQALQAGAYRHEQILTALTTAEIDISPEEMRTLHSHIEQNQAIVQSLLTTEGERVDFMLRLLLGPTAEQKPTGYPKSGWRQEGASRMLNQRA